MPVPWTVERIPGGYRVGDAGRKAMAYVYGLEPNELPAAGHLGLTKDKARRVASNIAKVPYPLRREKTSAPAKFRSTTAHELTASINDRQTSLDM